MDVLPLLRAQLSRPDVALRADATHSIQYVTGQPCNVLKIVALDAPARVAYVLAQPQQPPIYALPAKKQTRCPATLQATSNKLLEAALRATAKKQKSCQNDVSKKKIVCKKTPPCFSDSQDCLYSRHLQPIDAPSVPAKKVRTSKPKLEATSSTTVESVMDDAADDSQVVNDSAVIAAKRYRRNEALMNIILSDVKVKATQRLCPARKLQDLSKCLDALEDDVDRMHDAFQVKLQAAKEANDLFNYKLRRFRELETFILSDEFHRSVMESELELLKNKDSQGGI